MDRKEFLRSCATGLCACAMTCIPVAAAENKPAEDWRLGFVKQRYTKLLECLSAKMDEEMLAATLRELGSNCATIFDDKIEKYRGDVDGFGAFIKTLGSGDRFFFDPVRKMVIATSEERSDCICPLIGKAYKTPGIVCNCSIGWHQYTWKKLLQKDVRVTLKEAVMRGGKHCTLEIEVLDQPA